MPHVTSPVLIPQVTGRLTYLWYAGAVIFTDHASDFTYVHLITSNSLKETLYAKYCYEQVAKEHGVMKVPRPRKA